MWIQPTETHTPESRWLSHLWLRHVVTRPALRDYEGSWWTGQLGSHGCTRGKRADSRAAILAPSQGVAWHRSPSTLETRRACSNIHYISEHNDDILQAEAVKITERPGVFLVEYHAGLEDVDDVIKHMMPIRSMMPM